MNSALNPNSHDTILMRFAVLFLPIALLLTLAMWPLLDSYERGRISIIKARESGYLDTTTRLVRGEFSRCISDLKSLARDPELQHYLDTGLKEYREELSKLLQIHAEGFQRYDQIRILDTTGQEVIRINYGSGHTAVVPTHQLQNKNRRYYFLEASKLNEGEVYVSPIDLNMENGRIEIPYKPTIRFATPLFDRNGTRIGVLIFNYLGDILLQAFDEDMRKDILHQAMLLNSEGYWISHLKQEKEWGFMLQRKEARFQTDFPKAWQLISTTSAGEIEHAQGLLLFTTIYPLQYDPGSELASISTNGVPPALAQNYFWKAVIYIPRD